jgi:hypothetical protein
MTCSEARGGCGGGAKGGFLQQNSSFLMCRSSDYIHGFLMAGTRRSFVERCGNVHQLNGIWPRDILVKAGSRLWETSR